MDIELKMDDRVGIITITRGPHNYFDTVLLSQIADAAEELTADVAGCRSILLCSEGKNFCAGANFGSPANPDERRERARETYTQAARIFEIPVPVIACVQGAAVGGGMGLACAADFRIATDRTRFHANFVELGFHPGFALSRRLREIVGFQSARRLLLSGEPVRGAEAVTIGLADQLVSGGQLFEKGLEEAHRFGRLAPLAVRSVKATLNADLRAELPKVLEHELDEQARLWNTEDARTGISASLRRESPIFVGR